ncbi:DUF4011 domain-containing protein [Nostoc sp. FACHB-110]|uniref:DUF4011 domain-containing protein n=1 Tax=Nostoc sp. FACHB-110 TaxID=2692834 RepID=UPI0016820F41|nr:DUF4011 domain-containing protein [Nostoc sp. FACHB-110]MBD2440543.1 DUF4011 domain-containing protein [Nostoc sp. FACHB-110]
MRQSNPSSQQNLIQKIAKWKAGLADIGKRNPLIKFREDSPRTLEVLTNEPGIIFQNLIKDKKTLKFQILDSEYQDITRALAPAKNQLELITRQTGNEQLKRLKKIRAEARKSVEERGVNSLFLALGTLTWYDKDKPEEALISPLILVPVELSKESRRDVYKISALDEDVVLNPTLAQKLKQTFGIDFPEAEVIEDLVYNEILTQVRQILAAQKRWQIKENIFLSLFSYAKATMIRDIIENEARIFSHPILQAISGDLTNYQSNYKEPLPASALDAQIKPERIFQILDADSSQQVVIEAAKSGSSFVVQGPPGTGKSQTIVNIITELVGAGKSVLLVAEKETALSVVYKRIAECRLEHICLNLHHSGTTDKRELVKNLSKTIDDLAQISGAYNRQSLFERLVSTRQSLNFYLNSLHIKEKPLDKSPFEIFGEILRKERESIPDVNLILSNFNEWTQNRLLEAKDLLTQLAQFLPFFKGERTTIWAKSSLNSYSYALELEIREKLGEFQQAILTIPNLNQKLQSILQLQPVSNLASVETYDHTLSYISKAPIQLPENWVTTDIFNAQNAFNILKTDVQELEKNSLTSEAKSLLRELSSFLPFLRRESTNIWENSKIKSFFETLEIELNSKLDKIQQSIFRLQSANQRLQTFLGIEPLLKLADIEACIPALRHIQNAPSELPENWTRVDIPNADNAFNKLKADIKFLEENEPFIKQKYHSDLFSSELSALANRFQRYSRFWIIRVFNRRYRRDIKLVKRLSTTQGKISYNELKRDLAQAVKVQAARNELYHSAYPAHQVFGSLFNPEVSQESELSNIEAALSWVNKLQQYSLSSSSVQRIVNSPSLRNELTELVNQLESFAEDFQEGLDFLLLYFDENAIIGSYVPRNQISLTDIINFIDLAKADLAKFRDWLSFKKIYEQLQQSGLQEFVNALRDGKPNPIVFLRNKISQTDYLPAQVFGSLFNPQISTIAELQPIEEALNWLVGLQQYSLPANSVQRILNSPSLRRELAEIVKNVESTRNQINQGLDFLLSHFKESDITDSYLSRNQIPFVELENFLNLAQAELAYFQEWLTYKEIYERLENLGAKKFLDILRESNLEPTLWFPVLEKRIYQTCLDAILAQKPELKNFNVELHEQKIKEFSQLDTDQLDAARKRLKLLHVQCWQNSQKSSVIQDELAILRKEANKKRQHLPIRKLLNDKQKGIPNLVKALKPCWMMSPLSVSQYINADVVHFDVLIFDEASQLRTEDVVPAILRADQVIVIGDRKQLPPTSFFATGTGESEEDLEDEDDASYESVLDECSNFMFGRTLKWHYRSQDERLIAFSNKNFYESELVTFPNPIQNPDLGVWFRHVADGVYDRSGRRDNQREAQVVAQLACEHFQRVPDQSLGIIAFSEAQADAIQEQIEILGKNNPEFDIFCSDNSPQFFLKALENVQGDERDAIILSVGYGRDSEGKLNLNFGPINKLGGERRLNVAVTRAKSKITLVSSIVAGDIDISRSKSKGLRLLRDYLEYAATGGERLEGNLYTDQLKFDSPFEEDVYHTLAERGYTIRSQVGCSGYRIDLAVVNQNRPGEFVLGIECDGASYHSSPTARDRDRLRQQVLEKLGWKIHRIWSTDWFRNKPAQVRLLIEKIEQHSKP